MARTIEEIKGTMTAKFMNMQAVRTTYGIDGTKGFSDCFSQASIENVLFYVFAFAVWALEQVFDLHRDEVEKRIAQLEPHTLRWYSRKAKEFMWCQDGSKTVRLYPDTDQYDTTGMDEAEIEKLKPVKYAVATENNTVVYLKVAAADKDGNPTTLTAGALAGLVSYVNEIKDAGVSVVVRNEKADRMKVQLTVFYDPTLLSVGSDGKPMGADPVGDAVKRVIQQLPFNGVFRKSDLMAQLQGLDCVKAVDITGVQTKTSSGDVWADVSGYSRPFSGYYALDIDESKIRYVKFEELDADV